MKMTKIVSFEYEPGEEKERVIEAYKMIESMGAKVKKSLSIKEIEKELLHQSKLLGNIGHHVTGNRKTKKIEQCVNVFLKQTAKAIYKAQEKGGSR